MNKNISGDIIDKVSKNGVLTFKAINMSSGNWKMRVEWDRNLLKHSLLPYEYYKLDNSEQSRQEFMFRVKENVLSQLAKVTREDIKKAREVLSMIESAIDDVFEKP